jgi:hypothetical protein
MGNTDSKVDFRVAVVQLTSRSQVKYFTKNNSKYVLFIIKANRIK